MSETTEAPTQPAPDDAPPPPPAETDPPAPETADATQAAPDAPADTTDEPAKPTQADRRFAILSSRLTTEAEARRAAETELAAARALLNAGKPDEAPTPPAETVEQAAARLVAERDSARARNALIEAGRKEYTAAVWDAHADVLHSMGATTNQAFMAALVELPNATKIVAHLAEDVDALQSLLNKSPLAMATEMGRMAAEMSRPAPARPLSNAPRPANPIASPATPPEPDVYDEKMS